MEGWIKLHRKLLDNPIVSKDRDTISIWIYLLLNATHKEIPAIFKGKKITLKPGQLITGILSISKQLKIDKNKIQRTLKCFENDKQIVQETSNQNRLISIVKWDIYQENDKPMINERETSDKQVITNNNERNKEYITYFINKYSKEGLGNFNARLRFLREIQKDEKYNDLTPEEETELRTYVLGRRY